MKMLVNLNNKSIYESGIIVNITMATMKLFDNCVYIRFSSFRLNKCKLTYV